MNQAAKPADEQIIDRAELCLSIIQSAGRIALDGFRRRESEEIAMKGSQDFLTETDAAVEAHLKERLAEALPEDEFLGEETGASGDNEVVWIIDPLDGTTNFLHQFPQFAVSIGIQVRGRLEHGVVYNPFSQELYTASRGAGASLDGRRIRVSRADSLEGALIGTGFPFREDQDIDGYIAMFSEIMRKTAGVRRAGAAALDLAFVAAGRLDGFWELGLQPWDMAAGIVLVREAGGMIGDISGRGEPMDTGNIVVGNPKVYEALGGTIMRHLRTQKST